MTCKWGDNDAELWSPDDELLLEGFPSHHHQHFQKLEIPLADKI
jgi:hypothetical protein